MKQSFVARAVRRLLGMDDPYVQTMRAAAQAAQWHGRQLERMPQPTQFPEIDSSLIPLPKEKA